MFCACPNFLSQPKDLTAFSASSKTFVLAQKTILLNANHLNVNSKTRDFSSFIERVLAGERAPVYF